MLPAPTIVRAAPVAAAVVQQSPVVAANGAAATQFVLASPGGVGVPVSVPAAILPAPPPGAGVAPAVTVPKPIVIKTEPQPVVTTAAAISFPARPPSVASTVSSDVDVSTQNSNLELLLISFLCGKLFFSFDI